MTFYYDLKMSSAYDNMRRGVGVGLNVDLKDYTPESKNPRAHIYCGTDPDRDKGSDRECFLKGFTIGKNLQYDRKGDHKAYSFPSTATLRSPSSIPLWILILCILVTSALLLFVLITSQLKGWNKVAMSILCLGLLAIAVSYFIYGWNAYSWFNIT